jgi:hypothetical protein
MKTIRLLTILLLAAPILEAAWTAIETFEGDPANPNYTYVATLGSRETPTFNFLPDPAAGDNTVFWLDPEAYGKEWMVIYANWELEEPIREGSTGTLYFRYYVEESNSTGPIVGFTDVPYAEDGDGIPTQPTGWESFEPALALGGSAFNPRDGGAYVATEYVFQTKTWYEIWTVVNNREGVFDDDTKYYVKGPGDTEPVHVPIPDGSGGFFDTALFRNGTTDDLIGLFYGILAGNPNSPQTGVPSYTDDFYIDVTGENLTTPDGVGGGGTMTWGGIPVTNGFVDTGDWLGWLAIHETGFVYSFLLSDWIYFSDPGNGGGWAYFNLSESFREDLWDDPESLWMYSRALSAWIYFPLFESNNGWGFVLR